LGFALGDKKADGTCKFQADYEADFSTLGGTSKLVRIYAASDCDTAKEILPAAKSSGFQVILGIWYALFSYHVWGVCCVDTMGWDERMLMFFLDEGQIRTKATRQIKLQ